MTSGGIALPDSETFHDVPIGPTTESQVESKAIEEIMITLKTPTH